jgi:hypothetical protein
MIKNRVQAKAAQGQGDQGPFQDPGRGPQSFSRRRYLEADREEGQACRSRCWRRRGEEGLDGQGEESLDPAYFSFFTGCLGRGRGEGMVADDCGSTFYAYLLLLFAAWASDKLMGLSVMLTELFAFSITGWGSNEF